jgi:hypothetical protein
MVAARRGDRPDHLVDEPEFEVEGSNSRSRRQSFKISTLRPVSRPLVHEAEIVCGVGRSRSPAGLLEAFPQRAAGGAKIPSEIWCPEWQKFWGDFALGVWGQKQ